MRLFHTSVARAIATWPKWPGATGFTGDFEEYVAQRFPSSTAADFAVLEAGVVSEETYVEQGLYWEKLMTSRSPGTSSRPTSRTWCWPATRRPTSSQHQFLGLVTKRLINGKPNPAYDDVQVNGTPDHRVAQRRGFIRQAYAGADDQLAFVQKLLQRETTFVASDHGFAPQFAAVDAS